MQRVRLLGELGERFGAEHTYYNLRTPADAIKILCINKPEFKDFLLKSEENGIGYQVLQGGQDFTYEELLLPFGEKDLVITPVLTGSGEGAGNILAGIGLIALAFVTAGVGLTLFGLAVAPAIGYLGGSLLFTGIAQAISPQPAVPTLGGFGGLAGSGSNRMGSRNRTNGPENVTAGIDGQQSYAYTGAANTVGVGATVPLAYGKVLVGSHLLKSKFQIADESDPVLTSLRSPGVETMRLGNEILTRGFEDKSGVVARQVFKTVFDSAAYFSPVGQYGVTNNTQLIRVDPTVGPCKASLNVYGGYMADAVDRQRFDVALSLQDGLYDYAGGPGTTFVDGYITYEIKVFRDLFTTDDYLIAADQATIQGLIFGGQFFGWMHRMELPQISTESQVTVQVTVIAAGAAANGSNGTNPIYLRLNSIGYRLY